MTYIPHLIRSDSLYGRVVLQTGPVEICPVLYGADPWRMAEMRSVFGEDEVLELAEGGKDLVVGRERRRERMRE